MGHQLLLLPGTQAAGGEGIRLPLAFEDWAVAERAFELASKELAENSRIAYGWRWKRYCEWCADQDVRTFPVDPAVLIVFLQDLGEQGYSRTWLQQAIYAIAKVDVFARMAPTLTNPEPVYENPLVRSWWKAWRREKPLRQRSAPYLTPDQLRRLVLAIYDNRDRLKWGARSGVVQERNRLMLLLGYYLACRSNELLNFRLSDVQPSEAGIRVHFRKSKVDQEGKGETREIFAQREGMMCPVEAFRVWTMGMRAQGKVDPDQHLFGPIDQAGAILGARWTPKGLEKTFKVLSARAGVSATTHSLRAAFATHAHMLGHDPHEIAYHGRWKNTACMQRYVRREYSWPKNPTRELGLILLSPSAPQLPEGEPEK